ncbi:MAG: hypothetical protein JRG91_17165 [Deltaproteobacteria bacterium]|nr:hypothetical protein [Deltaproteobacteria bacterium]
MRAAASLTCALVILAAGTGCGDIRPRIIDTDAEDAPDAEDVSIEGDVSNEMDVPPDGVDPDAVSDPPVDVPDEEAGCTSDGECDDDEPCNGDETCGSDGECHAGTALADGTPCTSPGGVDGFCEDQVCRPPGCGDGIVSGTEDCDDENLVSGDGCESDCTYSCHAATDCDDSDTCTDQDCITGGTGQICDYTYNTATCDDADDCTHTDACDGAGTCTGTSYTCTAGTCEASSVCDGAGGCTVTLDSPGTSCDDLDACTHTDLCDSVGSCGGTTYACTPGTCETASDCDGSGGCTPTYDSPGASCDDAVDCTHTDVCDGSGSCGGTTYSCTPGTCEASSVCDGSGACTVTLDSPGTSCDDAVDCTHTDVCDGSGGCDGTTYSCTAGTCEASSVCDGSGGCTITFDAPGTTCTDVWACTTGETCDGSGTCVGGTPDDTACAPGELCRPTCFPSTGCGLPPGYLDVTCPDTMVLPSDAACTIDLDGVTGQVACLTCTTEIGMVELSNDDFDASGGGCDIGGWSLVTGDNCRDRIDEAPGCLEGGRTRTCCDDASTIDFDLGGDCVLRTDSDTNCGGAGDSREWRITRDFDTRGLTDLELCFRIADLNATDNDGILVYAIDSTHYDQVFCLEGPPVTGATPVNNVEWPYCVDLSTTWPWVENIPDLTIMFIAHSHDDRDVLFLDDIVLRGWSSTCTPTRSVAFTENFDPCPGSSPIPDGWNGWTITGGGPLCLDVCTGGSAGGAVVNDDQWTMTHAVDTSGLDGDVRLCFDVGDFNSDWNEWISVQFDTGTGSGFVEAWYWENEWGTDGACSNVCLHLSDMDEDAARNPNLQIRFQLSSNQPGEVVFIDDIVVDGAVYCDGTGSVSTSTMTDTGGGGYSFDLSDDAGVPMGAYAVCSWDTPPTPITGWDGTWFTSP